MDIHIIEAKYFVQRSDLEVYVRKQYGLTPENKADVILRGTKHELTKLGLSTQTTYWGIACECTEGDESVHENSTATPNQVDRGSTKPFGINGQTTKSS